MAGLVSPCTQDCPKCSAECRLTCIKSKVYEAAKRREYAERARKREIQNAEFEYQAAIRKRISRK